MSTSTSPFVPVLPPPVDPDAHGRGPAILGVTWALMIICIIIMGLRLHVRYNIARASGWDDWLMLLALCVQIFFQGCVTKAYTYGLGKHDINLTVDQLINIARWAWYTSIPAALVSVIARISAAILLIRIFTKRPLLKWYLILFTALQFIAAVVVIVITWLSASPVEGLWNPFIPARRWSPRVANYGAYVLGALFTLSDITYVLFPIIIIFRLNMPRAQKIGLAAILATSLLTAAACIMKTITTQGDKGAGKPDIQYNISLGVLWAGIEQGLVIILGCIPPLRTSLMKNSALMRQFSTILNSFGSRNGGSQDQELTPVASSQEPRDRRDGSAGSSTDVKPFAPRDRFETTKNAENIRRVDTFQVTYEQNHRQKQWQDGNQHV